MEIYICYIYPFFPLKSHKVWQTQLARKENTCEKVQVPLSPGTWIRSVLVAVRSWLEGKIREKRMLSK